MDLLDRKASLHANSFCHLERASDTSFGCRISLSSANTHLLLSLLNVSPQFISSLLGEPDYWAPGDFATHDEYGSIQRLGEFESCPSFASLTNTSVSEYFCQHPRWDIHRKDVPCSIYMSYDASAGLTTYLVVCSKDNHHIDVVKERLEDALVYGSSSDAGDPFLLHSLVTHQIFLEAKTVITSLRYKLYDELDRVDVYSQKPATERDKSELEDLTIALHVCSQETDSLTASADMVNMIVLRLLGAHQRYSENCSKPDMHNAITKTRDGLQYLLTSIESQKRWLLSYKTRKDIAMNLVLPLLYSARNVWLLTACRYTILSHSRTRLLAPRLHAKPEPMEHR